MPWIMNGDDGHTSITALHYSPSSVLLCLCGRLTAGNVLAAKHELLQGLPQPIAYYPTARSLAWCNSVWGWLYQCDMGQYALDLYLMEASFGMLLVHDSQRFMIELLCNCACAQAKPRPRV
jgi:hypothetical protein